MIRTKVVLGLVLAVAAGAATLRVPAQCRTATVAGGTSTTTYQSGFMVTGSLLTSVNALDSVYYESMNVVETATLASFLPMASTWVETGSDAGIPNVGPNLYGGVFANPTNSPITVTQVDINGTTTTPAGRPAFGAIVSSSAPTTGTWTAVSTSILRWTGSIAVPPHSAQEFLVYARPNKGTFTSQTDVTLAITVTGTGGPYTASIHQIQVNITTWAATAAVGFDLSGTATLDARTFVPSVPTGASHDFSVRVRHTDDSNTYSNDDVRTGLQLTVTIPKGWSSVSVPTRDAAWWNAPTIVQPTAAAAGSVTATTAQAIVRGTSTPANTLVIRATPPTATDSTNLTGLYTWSMTLSGYTRDTSSPGTISSTTQGIVQVVNPVNVELVSPDLTAGSIRQIDLNTYFNVNNGLGTAVESVEMDVYNYSTSAWEVVGTATPGATNTQLTKSFGSTYLNYLSGGKMRVRYVSSSSAYHRLRVDLLQWNKTLGYTVNNLTGLDTNVGDVARPYASITKALTSLTGQGGVYVEVGKSRTAPASTNAYAANYQVFTSAKSGIVTCKTLVQGVASGGNLPLIYGSNPASDSGFEVGGAAGNIANYVQIDSFEIQNCNVGLYSDPGTTGTVFTNCIMTVPAGGYGAILDTSTSASVLNNRTDGQNLSTFFGVWDYKGTNNTIDGNKCRRHKGSPGIFSFNSTGLVLQRNIVAGSYMGIHVSNPSGGFTLYNNTLDSNDYLGVYAENPTAAVTSRNNILSNNGVGWAVDSAASAARVSSNYDDVYNNKSNYTFHGTVTAGANNQSAAPSFNQTTDPTLTTYYQLNAGSPCLNAGTNVGLPYCGAAPDIGAVETCP